MANPQTTYSVHWPPSAATPSKKTRIVACQGSAQLVSAVAAMRMRDRQSTGSAALSNHLIIHDLHAPAAQQQEFAECIRTLANQAADWASIRFITQTEANALKGELTQPDACPQRLLQQRLGISDCDELLIGQNDRWVLRWLRAATPHAERICFGDGPGVNFTPAYYQPLAHEISLRNLGLRRWLKSSWRRWRGKHAALPTPDHDYYLLLPNLFDQQLDDFHLVDPTDYLQLFELFGSDLPERAPRTHVALTDLLSQPGQNVVLLTSNFSETGRMSLAGELESYRRLLDKLPAGERTDLVIKPHPRDAHEKIEQLTDSLTSRYRSCVTLNDCWTFYLPFESIYARYLSQPTALDRYAQPRETYVATVSSACISLEYLYGQHCQLGFGRDLSAKHFTPLWSHLRQIHERDLQQVIDQLRHRRQTNTTRRNAA